LINAGRTTYVDGNVNVELMKLFSIFKKVRQLFGSIQACETIEKQCCVVSGRGSLLMDGLKYKIS
jgi:hypothetical protein